MSRSIRCNSPKNRPSRPYRLIALSVAAVSQSLLFGPRPAWAAPRGAHVVSGNVSISQTGNTTIIHASNNSIVNFNSFNIAKGETVDVIEPSSTSRMLDRIVGLAPTLIDGSLVSNGQVFIVNPFGFVFGSTAQINVAGLTAVAGHLSNANFQSGVNQFTNVTGSINNMGQIQSSGPTALVGAKVNNAGSIDASNNTVVIAAGSEVYVGSAGGNIYAKVAPASNSVAANLSGSGDIYSLALGMNSQIKAKQIVAASAGSTSVSGSLDASSAQGAGGAVTVTGSSVALTSATVNASGANGGGTVLVGGGSHGQNPSVTNSQTTTVDSASSINADAGNSGNGGQVVVWSDGTTNFSGLISARGGAQSGNGGSVEVSGKQNLVLNIVPGSLNVLAPAGKTGNILFDPGDVDISHATSSGATITTGANTGSSVTDFDINAALAGGNVTVSTANGTGGNGTTDTLTVDGTSGSNGAAIINWSTPNNLTLISTGAMTLNPGASISSTDAGSSLNLQSPNTDIKGTLNIGGQLILADAAGSTTGTVNFDTGSSITALSIESMGTTTITSNPATTGGGQTYGGAVTVAANVTVSDNATGTISFNSTVDSAGGGPFNLAVTTGGGVIFSQAVGGTTPLGSFSVGGGGSVSLGGNVSTTAGQTYVDAVTSGATTLSLNDSSGAITFSNTFTGASTNLTLAGAGGNNLLGAVSAASLNTSGAGGTTLSAGVTTSGLQSYADAVTLGADVGLDSTGGGNITFASSVDSAASGGPFSLRVTTGGVASFQAVGHTHPLFSLTVAATADLGGDVTTTGLQTYDDAVSLTGNVGLDSTGGGAISFASTVDSVSTTPFNLAVSTSGTASFASTIGATNPLASLSVGGGGAVDLEGNVSTTAGQTYGDAVTSSAASLALNDSNGAITFNSTFTGATTNLTVAGAGGNVFSGVVTAKTFNTSGAGGTTLGDDVTTTGTQSYGDAVSISDNLGLDSSGGGNIIFSSTLDAVGGTPFAVEITTTSTGAASLQGVGTLHPLTSLTIAGGSGATSLNGNVTTTGVQSYGDAVSLAGNVDLSSVLGNIIFDSTVDSAGATPFSLSASGNQIVFAAAVGSNEPLLSVTTSGVGTTPSTSLAAGVTTTGGQTYNDLVTLSGPAITVVSTTGAITFAGGVSGTSTALTINTPGGDNLTGGTVNVLSLLLEGGGTDNLANVAVTTTAGQTYDDAISSTGGTVTLTDATGGITFSSTFTGASAALSVTSNAGNIFDGTILVGSFSTGGAGGTTFNSTGGVTTSGNQSYGDAVTLPPGTLSFVSTTGSITFGGGVTGASTVLTVNGAAGDTIGGGGTVSLISLNFTGGGTDSLGVALVTTTAGQTYNDALTMTNTTTTLMDTSGAITFAKSITGATTALTVDGRTNTFSSGTITLASLHTTGGGTDTLNVTAVNTSAGETYSDAVTSTSPTLALTDTAGTITFASTFTSPNSVTALTSSGAGGNIFDGIVIAKSLTTSGAGGTALTGVTTTGNQSYGDAVTFTPAAGTAVSLQATTGGISFGGNVTGATTPLIVNGKNGNTFGAGTTVNVLSLTTGIGGTTTIGGDVSTAGFQSYGDAVTLNGTVGTTQNLVDSVGSIVFRSTISDAATNLNIQAVTTVTFGQAVTVPAITVTLTGGASAGFISVSSAGLTTTGAGGQTFNGIIDDNGGTIEVENGNGKYTGFSANSSGQLIADDGDIEDVTPGGKFAAPSALEIMSPFSNDAANTTDPNFQAGLSRNTDIATIIAAAVSFEAPTPAPQTAAITASDASDLELLGIFVKADSQVTEQLAGQDTRTTIIVDWPLVHNPGLADRKVTPRRLDVRQVKAIVAKVEKIYGPHGANKKNITDQLASAIADYRAANNPPDGKVTPREFARYLAARANRNQRNIAYQLKDLADGIQNLGLSAAETQGANQSWSYDLTPDDEGLVNEAGQSYNGWLLDVLHDLPKTPPAAAPPPRK